MQSVLAADTLTGDRVVNRQKEDLGTIEHLMIDVERGRVAYAVLSFGGFLGMGDKLFAIPWSALSVDTGERQFILDVDKKLLERAPGFDKGHWPDMADRVGRRSLDVLRRQALLDLKVLFQKADAGEIRVCQPGKLRYLKKEKKDETEHEGSG
jgi:sporulation protein YlmC with PRC-barrel domain